MGGQQFDVAVPIAQGRHLQRDHVQAVEEILAETALAHRSGKIFVRRRDNTDIHLNEPVGAEAGEGPFLQDAEQLHLQVERHGADFVEEQHALVGQLEFADAPLGARSGERAARVAEQLAFEQGVGDGPAVDANEGLVPAVAGGVDGPGDEFLAGAGFAGDEDRGRGARDLADLIFQLEHGGRAPDEVFDAGKGVPEGRDAIRHARQGLEGEDRGKMVVRRRERGHLAHERVLAAPGGDHEFLKIRKGFPGPFELHVRGQAVVLEPEITAGDVVQIGNAALGVEDDDAPAVDFENPQHDVEE